MTAAERALLGVAKTRFDDPGDEGYGSDEGDDNDDDGEDASYAEPCFDPNKLAPAALAVNRQIHSEAAPFLYKQVFAFSTTYTLHFFLVEIGYKHRALLEKVVLYHAYQEHCMPMNLACNMLADATALKVLYIAQRLQRMIKRNVKTTAESVYKRMYLWLHAVARRTKRSDAWVDVLQ